MKATSPGRRGRKKLTAETPQLPPATPGQGARRLRTSINSIVSAESDRIARALYDKTLAGNAPSARLLVELAGDPPAEEDTLEEFSYADMLAAQPRLIGDNDELIQLQSGKIYKKVENLNGLDPAKLPFGNPKDAKDPDPSEPVH